MYPRRLPSPVRPFKHIHLSTPNKLTEMYSRVLVNALRRQASTLSIITNCRYTLRHTRPTALRSTSTSYVYVNTRYFASDLELDLLSSAEMSSVAATVMAELQKANDGCTGAGIDTLEETYAEKTHEEVLGYSQSYEL
ncbi:hypothetical protein TWF679_004791 [Orbilia oligospora]|uniref:Uncharacterized protein n=1 Tax=Orbilia oligospora TaxID=2813651 RepID=A0A8H8VDA9_ORBOL|nr:hypothetical protein TWF679_004791 [Orbilia oligospora]